jgi:hypothetical protein
MLNDTIQRKGRSPYRIEPSSDSSFFVVCTVVVALQFSLANKTFLYFLQNSSVNSIKIFHYSRPCVLDAQSILVINCPISRILRQLIYNLFYKTVYPLIHRPLIINTVNYKETEGILAKAMNLVTSNRLEGDYLEFGVYQGESFVTAYKFSKDYYGLKSMHFYAFDSFQGQPPLLE